ncbi:MAG: nucleotidyltransferase domain-containing protein [Candidatus Brocadiia bacterium]
MREPPIEEIVGKIVTAFHPRRVMLFGSLARGDGNAESDADILVEMETDLKPFDRRLAVDRIFGLRDWAMDVLVYTPEEVERFKGVVGTMLHTILTEGRVLYERP